MIFALVASGLWLVTAIYSIGYMRGHHEGHQTRFYAFFAVSLAATMGVAFAGNVLTLFVFYEALTLSTYPLVTHHGTPEAKRAGRVYFGILIGTSIGLQLPAIAAIYMLAGTLDFTAGGILAGKAGPEATAILFALFIFGIGKAALMPFHRWLPAAMVAPTPVSALLHAVAVVKAGVFAVLKVTVYVFGVDLLRATPGSGWLIYVAGFTILAASTVALFQDNLKRRLAYSTISQLSYVVIGAARAELAVAAGRQPADRDPRRRQDHPVLRRRRHPGRRPQDPRQRARRHRPADAVDHGRLRHRLAVDDRAAADRRLRRQVVPAAGRGRRRAGGRARRPRRQHPARTPPTSCRSSTPPSSGRCRRARPSTARRRWPRSAR